ncbi:UbiA family prenyltransferase [Nocardioides sp.]|uniref:UbiA family prenyltransferase n=1 Tax=Nocardioides sp. TaxID=35761 RepID=UPI003783AA08
MSPTLRRRKSAETAAPAVETPSGPSGGTAVAVPEPAAPEPAVPEPAGPEPAAPEPAATSRRLLAHSMPVLLVQAAHPRQAVLTAGGLAVAAALSGRSGREVWLVLATVLVGQAILGWFNDLVDRRRDAARLPQDGRSGKPIADGYLDPGTVWFALTCAVLLVVPLSVQNGVTAGAAYLASVAVGMLGNVVLRQGWLSWLPWAVAYGLYPFFLSYGGWGGATEGSPPQWSMVALAALLGAGVHVLCALPGLVADHEDGLRHLPLRIALRIGATRLLVLAIGWVAACLVGLLLVGSSVGLSR